MKPIKNYLKNTRETELQEKIDSIISELNSEGYQVEIGTIGLRTTYALLYTEDHESEIVGYTFIKNMKYHDPIVGKLKALQQAVARKDTSEVK